LILRILGDLKLIGLKDLKDLIELFELLDLKYIIEYSKKIPRRYKIMYNCCFSC
jgi:hypothetical protein